MKPLDLSAIGATPAVQMRGHSTNNTAQLPPGIIVTLSEGAVLTYDVEVTADRPSLAIDGAPSVFPDPGHWAPVSGMQGLRAAASGTIAFMAHGFRARITSHTSGILSFQIAE